MATNLTKKHFTYTIKDFYKKYKERKKEEGYLLKDIISYPKYRIIVEKFFYLIFKKIIHNNHILLLPYSMGSMGVKSVKVNMNNLKIDWKQSKEVGKIIKHLNLHTYGYYYVVNWDKSYVRFKNSMYYNFIPTSSRKASKLGIGKKGLSSHIIELSKDPMKRSYLKM